jgi:chloramphenicol-sensitive protein RarD
MTSKSKGFTAAAAAFALWGVFPLYFYLLHQVSPLQVIAHRVVWS